MTTNHFSILGSLEEKLRGVAPRTCGWEARMVLRHVAGREWVELYARGLSKEEEGRAWALVERRVAGEPLAYVLGDAPFGGLELKVGLGVLIPRVETELLVEAALDVCKKDFSHLDKIDVLDLGTGTGCISLAVAEAEPRAHVDAVENSTEALRYAAANVSVSSARSRIDLIAMDYLTDNWTGNLKSAYHLILANPPYVSESDWASLPPEVKLEPRPALVSGPKGDEILRWIIEHGQTYLLSGGVMILEVGIGQAEPLGRFAASFANLHCDRIILDHQNIGRILMIRKNKPSMAK